MSLVEPDVAVHAHRADRCLLSIYQRGRLSIQLRAASRTQRDLAVTALLHAAAAADPTPPGGGAADAPPPAPPPRPLSRPVLCDFHVTVRRAAGEPGLHLLP